MIDILISRKWYSRIQNVRIFRDADCNADHNLVAANLGKEWQ